MNKKIAAAALALSLAGGGAGLTMLGSSAASAANTTTSSASGSTPTDAQRENRGEWMTTALDSLVENQTLTQAQADAVAATLEAARPARGEHGGRGPGLDVVATALGTDAATLRSELQSGTTVAALAAEKGVDVQSVIDAIAADMKSHLADAVETGRLTQAEADERAAAASTRATDLVNGNAPAHPDGPRGDAPVAPNA